MSLFKRIELKNFRNFQYYENAFSSYCNIFYGKNGSGKTNILESISLFDKGTGIRNDSLTNLVKSNQENFSNTAVYNSLSQDYEIKVYSEKKNLKLIKKIIINNDSSKETIKYFRSFLSFITFQPEMERLFLLSPSYRRKFLDRFVYSYNKDYNKILNDYKKNVFERSNLLKSNDFDEIWISNIEENIAKLGIKIYDYRNKQIAILNNNLKKLYSEKKSPFSINLNIIDKFLDNNINDFQSYKDLLKNNRKIDLISGGANFGPHKSDLLGFVKNEYPLNQLSTGEQKTIVLLLIFAQCNFLVNECKIYPIMLLDEICSHLDEINRSILLNLSKEFKLQFFMTGTDKNLFSFLSTNTQYYNISI